MKATVTINRGQGQLDTFTGDILAESTTHVKVQTSPKLQPEHGEWFAKESKNVNCVIV